MARQEDRNLKVLERGSIYFLYRPKMQEESAEGVENVQRFYIVLRPQGERRFSRITVGRKRLPEPDERGRYWGFVEQVAREPRELYAELGPERYQTRTRGERERPAARPAGEGVYAIVRHGDHTHLAYALELPQQPDEVQQDLNIEEEGNYIISIKNPEQPSPRGAGLQEERQAEFPAALQRRFSGRRFIDADPPDFLAHSGAEVLLIASGEDVSQDLGLELHPERETEASADIFKDLRLNKETQPVEPLFTGHWA